MHYTFIKVLIVSSVAINIVFCNEEGYGKNYEGTNDGYSSGNLDTGYGASDDSKSESYSEVDKKDDGYSGYGGGYDAGYGGGYDAGYGGGYDAGYGGGYGGGNGGGNGGGYGGGYDSYSGTGHTINAAILSHQSVNTIPIQSSGGQGKPTLVNVDAGVAPIVFKIKSRSSPIIPKHSHIGTGGSFKKTFSRDKPHKMVHIVKKPVIHELKEIVTPFRRHIQRVRPVKQSIRTFVHQNSGHY